MEPDFVEFSDITLHFHHEYYDGPLSGSCEYMGNRYWFRALSELRKNALEVHSVVMIYGLYELSENEWTRIDLGHQSFQNHVGYNTDYGYGDRLENKLHPRERWGTYYELFKDEPPPRLGELNLYAVSHGGFCLDEE